MKNRFFIALAMVVWQTILFAQRPEKFHNEQVRYFDQEKLDKYQGQERYVIVNKTFDAESNRVKELPDRLKDKPPSKEKKEAEKSEPWSISLPSFDVGGPFQLILIILLIVGIGILVYYLAGGSFNVSRSTENNQDASDDLGYENIHELDFESKLQQALSTENYKEASRLLFLRSLKKMSDNGTINWKINKTNRDYYYEIKKKEIKSQFREVSLLFEYMVYGDFDVSLSQFQQMQVIYDGFDQLIQK